MPPLYQSFIQHLKKTASEINGCISVLCFLNLSVHYFMLTISFYLKISNSLSSLILQYFMIAFLQFVHNFPIVLTVFSLLVILLPPYILAILRFFSDYRTNFQVINIFYCTNNMVLMQSS